MKELTQETVLKYLSSFDEHEDNYFRTFLNFFAILYLFSSSDYKPIMVWDGVSID